MVKPPKADRRRWERIPIAIPIFLLGKDHNGKEFREFSTALNISPGGVLLATRRYLPPLSAVSLEIPSGPFPKVGIAGKFIRSLPGRTVTVTHGEQCYLCGVKFERPVLKPRVRRHPQG
jgi:hypothetical protein